MPHYLLSPETMFSHVRIIGVFSRTMTLGLETTDTTRTSVRVKGLENIKPFLDTFHKFGHTELDTARIYCLGDTETVNFPTFFFYQKNKFASLVICHCCCELTIFLFRNK